MGSHRLRWARISVAALTLMLCVVRAEAIRKVVVGPKTTLDGLARKYDVPKTWIARANGIDPEALLRDGQILAIPDPPPMVKVHPSMAVNGSIRGDRVALRRGPATEYLRVTLLDSGARVCVTAKLGDWYQVRCQGTPNAWVRADFVKLEAQATTATAASRAKAGTGNQETARKVPSKSSMAVASIRGPRVIRGDRVSVRKGASRDTERIAILDDGAQLTVLGTCGDWYKVRLASGRVGYVLGRYVSHQSLSGITPQVEMARLSSTRRLKAGTSREVAALHPSRTTKKHIAKTVEKRSQERTPRKGGNEVVRTAFAYRGTRYRYGGSARGGFDCSGFTSYIYRTKGVDLPHNAAAQFRCGKPVAKSELKAGDLVFFTTTRRGISHVGIYVGNGNFVHASSARGQVRVDTLSSGYYAQRYRGARRVR